MGFHQQYLAGEDATYKTPESVVQSGQDRFETGTKFFLESTQNDDPNHFDPTYFGAGAKWHDPNVDKMIRTFRRMRVGVERSGSSIHNATEGGALEELE